MDDKEREIFSRLNNYDFYEENFTTYKPEEIEINGKLIANIGFKLLTASYVMIAAGAAVIALTRNIWGIIFGLVPIALGVIAIIRIKDYRTMDIYDGQASFTSQADICGWIKCAGTNNSPENALACHSGVQYSGIRPSPTRACARLFL